MTTVNTRTTSLWKTVYDKLHAELTSCEYGSDFYTAAQVCKKFDVSQITAIRVLNELARSHLIEKIPGKGSVVRRISKPIIMRMLLPANTQHDLLSFDYSSSRRFEGVAAAAREQGIDFSVLSEKHLSNLFPRQNDEPQFGFLLLHQVSRQTRKFLRSHGLPFVLVDPLEHYKGWPHARVDRIRAGYLATRHLLEQGHRRIAWITAPITNRNFRQRVIGYRQALAESDIKFDWSLIKEIDYHDLSDACLKHFHQQIKQLLSLRRPPTAILAGDDTRAMQIYKVCQELGIDVPSQLSVVGYPNYPESSLMSPPLSVIDANHDKTGQAAVKLLLEQMLNGADPSTQAVMIEPELIERQSVCQPRPTRKVKPAETTADAV